MTIKRLLLGAAAAVGLAGSAAGQGTVRPWPENDTPPVDWFTKAEAPAVAPSAVKPAAATDILAAPPSLPAPPAAGATAPPGTVYSPWCGGGNGCCGPIGGNGPLTYELYFRTGPSIVWGSELARSLNTGWQVGGGARTLWFNQQKDAAWVLIGGMSYTYNRGQKNGFLDVGTPSNIDIIGVNGTPVGTERGPDLITSQRVRGFHRTSFDFGIGRDLFLGGSGALPDGGCTWRVGADLGGRWGTAHVDMVPRTDPNNYTRRQDVFHSLWTGVHADWEQNMGSWILFGGGRVEYDITWANHVPPRSGDIQGINILLNLGVRF